MTISPYNNTLGAPTNPSDKFAPINDNYEHTKDIKEKKKLEAKMKAAPNANPLGQLDKDAFMKLLLQELRYQDPTSPMDSDKMLTQTSQLAGLETQEKTNQTMEKLAKKMELMSDSMGVGMISAVGKLASLKTQGYKYDGGKQADLGINFYIPKGFETDDEKVKITMVNDSDQEVKTMQFSAPSKSGNNNFLYDMSTGEKDEDGNNINFPKGNYRFILSYTDKQTKEIKHITSGDFEITGVRMKDGKAQFLADDLAISFDDIREFKDIKS